MPALKNPRHEAFAPALARGVPAAKAYVDAGYKPNRGNTCDLKQGQALQDDLI
jgi:phage terminase small subunit